MVGTQLRDLGEKFYHAVRECKSMDDYQELVDRIAAEAHTVSKEVSKEHIYKMGLSQAKRTIKN